MKMQQFSQKHNLQDLDKKAQVYAFLADVEDKI